MKDYLTWWETIPYTSSNGAWDWLPDDPLFHAWFHRRFGSLPDPRWNTSLSSVYFTQLHTAAELWRYMRMRQLEGKPLFTEPAGAA